MKSIRHIALALSLLLLVACEKKPPEPVEISGTTELSAKVIAVDAGERIIELEGPDGDRLLTRVGPDVRNLEQVKAGDTLTVRYQTAYAIAMAEPGEAGSDMAAVAGRAAEGELPAGLVGSATRATVEILSVGEDGKSVSFRDSDGRVQSVHVHREEVQAFAKRLKQGDLVDIQYADALTVSIERDDPET